MHSHKWLRAHEKPLADPVGSVASAATRRANVKESESSQDQSKSKKSLPGVIASQDIAWKVEAELRKRVERVRGLPRESARTKPQREDRAQ